RIDVLGQPEAARAPLPCPSGGAQAQRRVEPVGRGLRDQLGGMVVVHRDGHAEAELPRAQAVDEAPANRLVGGQLARAPIALVGQAAEATRAGSPGASAGMWTPAASSRGTAVSYIQATGGLTHFIEGLEPAGRSVARWANLRPGGRASHQATKRRRNAGRPCPATMAATRA